MKKILLLDKDDILVRELLHTLQHYSDMEVIVANERNYVNRALQQLAIDLVVTDIEGTEECCFELLEVINRHFPTLPIDVLTPELSAEFELRLGALRIARRFEKPIDVDKVAENIHSQVTNSATGQLKGLSLPSVLQLMNIEKKHCILTVTSAMYAGELYIRAGEIIAARAGTLRGLDAAYHILSWENVSIELLGCDPAVTQEIDEPFMSLIMEALRLKDEEQLPPVVTEERGSDGNNEAPPVTAMEKRIISLLNHFPGVTEYSLFDRQDNLRFFFSKRKQERNALRPRRLREEAEQMAQVFNGGSLKYMLVNERSGLRQLFFPYDAYCVAVGLRRDQTVEQFMQQFATKMEQTTPF